MSINGNNSNINVNSLVDNTMPADDLVVNTGKASQLKRKGKLAKKLTQQKDHSAQSFSKNTDSLDKKLQTNEKKAVQYDNDGYAIPYDQIGDYKYAIPSNQIDDDYAIPFDQMTDAEKKADTEKRAAQIKTQINVNENHFKDMSVEQIVRLFEVSGYSTRKDLIRQLDSDVASKLVKNEEFDTLKIILNFADYNASMAQIKKTSMTLDRIVDSANTESQFSNMNAKKLDKFFTNASLKEIRESLPDINQSVVNELKKENKSSTLERILEAANEDNKIPVELLDILYRTLLVRHELIQFGDSKLQESGISFIADNVATDTVDQLVEQLNEKKYVFRDICHFVDEYKYLIASNNKNEVMAFLTNVDKR